MEDKNEIGVDTHVGVAPSEEEQPTSGRSFAKPPEPRNDVPPEILELIKKEKDEKRARLNRKPSGGHTKPQIKKRNAEKLRRKSRKKNRNRKK